jgi:hypothetical protein
MRTRATLFLRCKKMDAMLGRISENVVLEKLDRLNGTPRTPRAASVTDYRDRFIKCQSSNAFG